METTGPNHPVYSRLNVERLIFSWRESSSYHKGHYRMVAHPLRDPHSPVWASQSRARQSRVHSSSCVFVVLYLYKIMNLFFTLYTNLRRKMRNTRRMVTSLTICRLVHPSLLGIRRHIGQVDHKVA